MKVLAIKYQYRGASAILPSLPYFIPSYRELAEIL